MNISRKIILISTIMCALVLAQSGKPTVAILDFEGQGVDIGDVQTLTERMRTEIGNTNAVRLIERKAVEKIMEEQGFQQSGCTSDECAAEVGQLLGVQFMVSGTIGKMGKKYTIDCKMPKKTEVVLVCVAHRDDESLGCAGAIQDQEQQVRIS